MASDKPRDGFFTKVIVATVVVIWVSLVGGNWLGHYAIEQGYLGKEEEAVEFRDMPSPAPRPWVKIDPKLQEELEQHRRESSDEVDSFTPTPTATVTATPLAQPDEAARPVARVETGAEPEPAEGTEERPAEDQAAEREAGKDEPEEPRPTPEVASDGDYRLQFGAFGDQGNAKRLADELTQKGQSAVVEEIDTADGKVYRVRGEVFQEAGDAKVAAESLKEQGIQVFVVSQ